MRMVYFVRSRTTTRGSSFKIASRECTQPDSRKCLRYSRGHFLSIGSPLLFELRLNAMFTYIRDAKTPQKGKRRFWRYRICPFWRRHIATPSLPPRPTEPLWLGGWVCYAGREDPSSATGAARDRRGRTMNERSFPTGSSSTGALFVPKTARRESQTV